MLLLIKKIFNAIVGKKKKDEIRIKFKKIFIWIDKRLYYKEYLKVYKFVLKRIISKYEGPDYGYRYGEFLTTVRKEYIKWAILEEENNITEKDMLNAVSYVRKNGLDMYCGGIDGVMPYSESDIGYDEDNNLFYGMYEHKKMYFSTQFDTAQKALDYLNGLAAEQSEHSPHKYLSEDFNVGKEDIILDIGSAEGNFALSIIDKVKKIYLFECEEEWIKPLELTFAPYKDKIEIIRKYASKESSVNTISIDDFCKENTIEYVDMIKMDVEGAEKDVLAGATEMLKQGKIKKIAACVYHKMNDEKEISKMLPNYHKAFSEGYMLGAALWSYEIWNEKPPYFTRGVMRAALEE